MERLDKVIRALNCCLSDAECDFGCPYWSESENSDESACELMKRDMLELLRNMESVVHAHWEDEYGGKYANPRYRCSVCKARALYAFEKNGLGQWFEVQAMTTRCHCCGAHMDEGVADES